MSPDWTEEAPAEGEVVIDGPPKSMSNSTSSSGKDKPRCWGSFLPQAAPQGLLCARCCSRHEMCHSTKQTKPLSCSSESPVRPSSAALGAVGAFPSVPSLTRPGRVTWSRRHNRKLSGASRFQALEQGGLSSNPASPPITQSFYSLL